MCGLLAGCGPSSHAVNSYAVRVTYIPRLGQILADGAGYSLYIYQPDDQGPRDASASVPKCGLHSSCHVEYGTQS
jgi:hypothetical protein